MPPTISIIIPVLNEAANVKAAVARAREVGDEIIVADGGSTDGTVEIAQVLNCVCCHSPRGRGQQLAAGAKASTGDIFLFLHADNWLDSDARQQIHAAWQDMPADGETTFFGCFKQRIDDKRFIYRLIEKGNYWRARYQKLPYGDQGIFVSRQLYETVGGMPQIPLMEDFEFSRQVSKLASLRILQGPLHVDPRRWSKVGPLRQSIRNWTIATRYRLGASPESLLHRY